MSKSSRGSAGTRRLETKMGMASKGISDSGKSQSDKFEDAARELECDDDEQRFRERVGKLVKHKPVEKPGA